MHNFKELKVWQKAIDLILEVYRLTESYPKSELYGVISQTQRAAVSISCNISEGCGKSTKKDFKRFLEIGLGSTNELENLVIVANRLGYLKNQDFVDIEEKIQEINRMLKALIKIQE